MIIQFPDGTAIASSIIAAIRMSKAEGVHPGRLQVYTFQCRDSLLFNALAFGIPPWHKHDWIVAFLCLCLVLV